MPSVGCLGARVSSSNSALVGKAWTVGSKMDCLEVAPGLSPRALLCGTNPPSPGHNGKCLREKTAACVLNQHTRGKGASFSLAPLPASPQLWGSCKSHRAWHGAVWPGLVPPTLFDVCHQFTLFCVSKTRSDLIPFWAPRSVCRSLHHDLHTDVWGEASFKKAWLASNPLNKGFPGDASGKEPACHAGDMRD